MVGWLGPISPWELGIPSTLRLTPMGPNPYISVVIAQAQSRPFLQVPGSPASGQQDASRIRELRRLSHRSGGAQINVLKMLPRRRLPV